ALGERATRAENVARRRRHERLATANVRLAAGLRANADAHRSRIGRQCERVATLSERARRAVDSLLRQRATSVERCGQLLNALSQGGGGGGGCGLVRVRAGGPRRRGAGVKGGMRLDINFRAGHGRGGGEGSPPGGENPQPPAASKPRGRRGNGNSNQGSLFGA